MADYASSPEAGGEDEDGGSDAKLDSVAMGAIVGISSIVGVGIVMGVIVYAYMYRSHQTNYNGNTATSFAVQGEGSPNQNFAKVHPEGDTSSPSSSIFS